MAQRVTTTVLTPNSLYNEESWKGHKTWVSINNGKPAPAAFGVRHSRTLMLRHPRGMYR